MCVQINYPRTNIVKRTFKWPSLFITWKLKLTATYWSKCCQHNHDTTNSACVHNRKYSEAMLLCLAVWVHFTCSTYPYPIRCYKFVTTTWTNSLAKRFSNSDSRTVDRLEPKPAATALHLKVVCRINITVQWQTSVCRLKTEGRKHAYVCVRVCPGTSHSTLISRGLLNCSFSK